MSAVNIVTLATLHLPQPMHLNSQGQLSGIVPQLHLISHLPTSFHHFLALILACVFNIGHKL